MRLIAQSNQPREREQSMLESLHSKIKARMGR